MTTIGINVDEQIHRNLIFCIKVQRFLGYQIFWSLPFLTRVNPFFYISESNIVKAKGC